MSDRGHQRPHRRGRLSRSGDFDRVYRDGSSRSNRFLVFYSFPRGTSSGQPRLGISVGRKVGGAVVRNRVKRTLREAFWAQGEKLPEGHDFVVVARPGVEELVEREGAAGLERSLADLLAGKTGDDDGPETPEPPPGQERLT
jgi:ribonuclease P protein component